MLQHSISLTMEVRIIPRTAKAQYSISNEKNTLTAFFNCQGGMHYEFVPRGQTVNKEFYLIILQCV